MRWCWANGARRRPFYGAIASSYRASAQLPLCTSLCSTKPKPSYSERSPLAIGNAVQAQPGPLQGLRALARKAQQGGGNALPRPGAAHGQLVQVDRAAGSDLGPVVRVFKVQAHDARDRPRPAARHPIAARLDVAPYALGAVVGRGPQGQAIALEPLRGLLQGGDDGVQVRGGGLLDVHGDAAVSSKRAAILEPVEGLCGARPSATPLPKTPAKIRPSGNQPPESSRIDGVPSKC